MMDSIIDEFITDCISGNDELGNYIVNLKNTRTDISAFCNRAAIITARRFLDRELSFDDADSIVNGIYALYIGEPIELPEPADSIYLAFDRAEYAIGDEDPIEEQTRPMLQKILAAYDE